MTTRRNISVNLAILAAAMLLGLAATPAGAVPYLESAYGGQSPWLSAEINGLGGSGGAHYRGGFSNILNPAGLARAAAWRVDAGMGFAYHEEERFVPLYDSFDSFVTDMSIASNQRTWPEGGFAVAGRLDLGDLPLGVGLSLADRNPFGYEFSEEVRDPDVFSDPRDRILEERTYEVEGTLRTLSLGVAGEADRISFGASVHYAFGDRDDHWLSRDNQTDDGDQSYDNRSQWDLSGVNATLGVQVHPNDRLTLGVAYETPLSVDGEMDLTAYTAEFDTTAMSTANHSLEFPARWRLGAAFFPRHDPRTVLTVDVVLTNYEDLKDDRPDLADSRLTAPSTCRTWWTCASACSTPSRRPGHERRLPPLRQLQRPRGRQLHLLGWAPAWPMGTGRLALSLELNKLQTSTFRISSSIPAGFVSPAEARVDDMRLRFGVGWTQEF